MGQLFSPQNPLLAIRERRGRTPPVIVASLVALFVIGATTGGAIILTYGLLFTAGPTPAEQPVLSAVALVINLILAYGAIYLFLWLWLRFIEGRPFSTLGLQTGSGALKKVVRGVAFGVLFFAAVSALMGSMGFLAFEGNEVGGPQGIQAIGGVLFVALGWAVQGSAEEVMFRGWLLQTATTHYGPFAGVLISTLVFVVAHMFSPNLDLIALTNLFLSGLFFALYALYEGSLWGVCALHAAMNWAEINVFGFDQSGEEAAGGVLFNLREAGPDFITGGDSPAVTAGGLVYSVVVLMGICIILFLAQRVKFEESRRSRSPLR